MTDRAITQEFFGENTKMFIGVVEDRNDPLQIGRAKLRIHGHHTDSKVLLPTSGLPWALPMMPITSASHSGVGETSGLMIGSIVVGFWGDWPDCQMPLMGWSIGRIEEGSSGDTTNNLHQPGNSVNDTDRSAGGPGTINPTGDGPQWLRIARGEAAKNIKEWPGASHNPEILKYGKDLGFSTDDSQHPWCAAFVRWCLKEAGQSVAGLTGAARSSSTAPCMERISEPILGCVALYHYPGTRPSSGHVAFWVGRNGGKDSHLGGNQGDAVNVTTSSVRSLIGYYWPRGAPKPSAPTTS